MSNQCNFLLSVPTKISSCPSLSQSSCPEIVSGHFTVPPKQQYVVALAHDKEFDLPDSVVEWMALLLRILDAPG
jgi:hypothetical protein